MRKCAFLLLATMLMVAPLTACRDRSNPTGQAGQPTATGGTPQQGPSRIDTILSRGKLICGVSGQLPGFSFVDEKGK